MIHFFRSHPDRWRVTIELQLRSIIIKIGITLFDVRKTGIPLRDFDRFILQLSIEEILNFIIFSRIDCVKVVCGRGTHSTDTIVRDVLVDERLNRISSLRTSNAELRSLAVSDMIGFTVPQSAANT